MGPAGPSSSGRPAARPASASLASASTESAATAPAPAAAEAAPLTSSPGHCTMVAAGNGDPRNTCKDAGAASCGTNGKCDGAGACQLYSKTTTCAGEACSQNVYTPFSTCDGAGRCVKPPSLPCAPYTCNGTRCFMACSADTPVPHAEPLRQELLRPGQQRRRPAPRATSASPASAPRASAATRPATAPACRAGFPARSGPAPPSPTAPTTRPASAKTRGPRPAGRTASARRALVRSTRPARRARPPLARAPPRPSPAGRPVTATAPA